MSGLGPFRSDHLAGRVALVTGAAGAGVGQATARALAAAGARVVVTDNHPRRTAEVSAAMASDYGSDRVVGQVLDISDRASTEATMASIVAEVGPIDILVNNAAVNVLTATQDMDIADWDRIVEIDLTAPWILSRAVLPAMIRRGSGSIINITSVAAYVGAATEGPYAAAKAALHSLTRTIASECGPAGVRCNAVAPGLVHSKFLERHAETFEGERSRTPLQRFAEPAEVASVVEFLASEAASYITGEVVNVSGGWYYRP